MLKIFCALMTSFLLNSCGEVANKSRLSVVVGTNDLSYYLEDDRISNSIGHIALGCTATHIGDGLVITAGHCITDLTCEDEKYDITWNFRSNNFDGQLVSKCAKIVVSENHFNGDYALLRYETYPEQSLKIDLDQQLQYGDKLTIFSHPNHRALSWSKWCEYEGLLEDQTYRMSYTCDTESGSSGAAVLNENFDIVGIHNLGIWSRKINGGTFIGEIKDF